LSSFGVTAQDYRKARCGIVRLRAEGRNRYHPRGNRTATMDGTTLHHRFDGPDNATCLVLSNSLGATLEMWRPQVARFSERFRVLRYDARGHGGSAVPPPPYTIAQLGEDVLRLLDACGVERAHFCGLSLGGATGIWLGAHAPDRIERLVLCNTAAWFGPPETMNARIETVRTQGLAALVDGILERWFTPEFRANDRATVEQIRDGVLATSAEGYVGCLAALRELDERDHLARIVAPTLVIGGTHDPAPKPEAARQLASAIRGARYVELPAAHLSNIGAARAFNDSVLAFLAGSPER
jgi:3-oxoadipate enol-lactonase